MQQIKKIEKNNIGEENELDIDALELNSSNKP